MSYQLKLTIMKTKNTVILSESPGPLLSLPLFLLLLLTIYSCAAGKRSVTAKDEPYVVVEEMPIFPGGDSALLAYIVSNTKYPEQAKTNNIQGRVIARFCINKEGGVDKISILKSVDPQLDAEAIRVVKSLPAFKPGKQGGKPVSVWYMVPITFALK
jgi:TonB family protein